MRHSANLQQNHLYSVFFAPRGSERMYNLGQEIAQTYLTPMDRLIGVMGEAGSGKSMIIKGMFPGLELTNDDSGVNIRPLPLLDIDEGGFFKAHTYHVDIRFEAGFTQLYELADAIVEAVDRGKRVVVEHFEMVYPLLKRNANLLIGVGAEVIVTRPTIFGPEPADVADIVQKSIKYRRMAHTAEDLVEYVLPEKLRLSCEHGDVRHGFMIVFPKKPDIDVPELEQKVKDMIAQDIPVTYHDERHVSIGEALHPCTGPRTHVPSTGAIENFRLLHELYYDPFLKAYLLVGQVGEILSEDDMDLNKIKFK